MQEHIQQYLSKNLRFDERKLDQYRDISVETDISKSAEGSARVKIGKTEVLAGVKFELGTPYPDSPNKGNLMVNAELLPLSSPDFEPGPPSIKAVELARVIDRGVRESGVIDFEKLCIEEGEKVWTVIVDIISVNDAGNLFDASSLAIMKALKEAKFPELKDGMVDYKNLTKDKLPLNDKEPLSVTIYKIGPSFIVDPTAEEEPFVEARLTTALMTDGKICAMQKGGVGSLTVDEIDTMVDLSVKKTQELRKHL